MVRFVAHQAAHSIHFLQSALIKTMSVRLWWPLFIFSLIISHLTENYSINIFYRKYLPTISCHEKGKKNPVCWSFMFQSVFGTYIFFKQLVKLFVFKLYFLCKQKTEFRIKFALRCIITL